MSDLLIRNVRPLGHDAVDVLVATAGSPRSDLTCRRARGVRSKMAPMRCCCLG